MTYQEEQNKLLLDFLLRKYKDLDMVEFIISPYCNQACEYCYLYKHGDELYPKESKDFESILNNFPILLRWLDKNNFKYKVYDIFSGEFFNLPIWEDIFQIIYDYEISVGVKRTCINIPTNTSFLLDDEKTNKIEVWMDKLKNIGIQVWLSSSIDGPESLEKLERPLKNNKVKNNQNFYKKFIDFRKKYEFASHPMITRNFVKDYKTNYDWWIDGLIENNITQHNEMGEIIYAIPMMLEVRDANQWDENSLADYKQFLNYVADKDFKALHNSNLDDFGYHFFDDFVDDGVCKKNGRYSHVQPYIINYPHINSELCCGIQKEAAFRLGDLAYVPCHRTCYPHFVFGYFKTQDEEINGLVSQKAALSMKIRNLNPNRSFLKCGDCPIGPFCMKGCLGSQYEETNEMFCPQDAVCNLFFTKYKTIHEIALRYNLYEWLEENPIMPYERKEFVKYARKILEHI